MNSRASNSTQTTSSPWHFLPFVPLFLVPIGYYYVRRYLAARKLAKTGIGRGAPGFQTSVKRIAVTPEIAARIKAGEQVSTEEIEAAVEKARQQKAREPVREIREVGLPQEGNEWIPEGNHKFGKSSGTAQQKKKKRR